MNRTTRTVTLIVALALECAGAFAADGAAKPQAFQDEFSKQTGIYDGRGDGRLKGYVIDRTLASYSETLPAEFARGLATLGARDRWLDIGAGEGNAIIDYFALKSDASGVGATAPTGSKASCVAISIEDRRTEQWYRTANALEPHHVQYFFGRPLREYSAQELGKFQIITDVIGGFSYTPTLDQFMEKALSMLALGGSLYTVLQDVHSEEGSNKPHYAGSPYLTEITAADGSKLKVCAWLKRIGCVEVSCELRMGWTPPIEVYHIRKTCENVTVPALTAVHYTAGTPPERRFHLKEAAPVQTEARQQ